MRTEPSLPTRSVASSSTSPSNVLLPPVAFPTLFVDPAGATGDYHVLPDSLAKDVAIWASGDATFDIDGDARAGRAGAPDYAGADVP